MIGHEAQIREVRTMGFTILVFAHLCIAQAFLVLVASELCKLVTWVFRRIRA